MNLGLLAVIISTLFGGTASMLMKKVSKDFSDNNLALVLQYIAMAAVALLLGAGWAIYNGTPYIPSLTLTGWLMVIAIGIIGYIGIMFLFKAYDHLSGAVTLVIANFATFIMYFVNLAIYPGQEAFGAAKFMIAIIFFAIIVQFLLDKKKKPLKTKKIFQWYTLYPLGTAVCWSIFFVGNNYLIKSGQMNPIQVGMLTETMILIVAVIWYMIQHQKHGLEKFKNACMGHKDRIVFIFIGLLNILSVYLTYYGYLTNPANTVNVIRLFAIPFASAMCWIFLKDHLTKKQILLLILAFIAMVGFLFV